MRRLLLASATVLLFAVGLINAAVQNPPAPIVPPVITVPAGAAAAEQTTMGTKGGLELAASFDGLGVGFSGPQGTALNPQGRPLGNPSDNSLAVGPDHI